MKQLTILLIGFCFLTIRAKQAQAQHEEPSLSYLALGDSYTIGHKVAPDQRWPVQLVEALRDSGLAVSDAQIIAKNGWTTVELKEAIADAELDPPYQLVSLLIGVNDQYDGLNFDRYPDRFRFLLKRAIELAGGRPNHVFVVSIPDYSVTPFGQSKKPKKINRELKKYNVANKSITRHFNVHYVNITPGSRRAANNSGLIASDGLHPSGKMYAQWVDQIMPVILPEVRSWPLVKE